MVNDSSQNVRSDLAQRAIRCSKVYNGGNVGKKARSK